MGRTACTEPQCLYSRAIPLLPLWAVRPVDSLSACTRAHFNKDHSVCGHKINSSHRHRACNFWHKQNSTHNVWVSKPNFNSHYSVITAIKSTAKYRFHLQLILLFSVLLTALLQQQISILRSPDLKCSCSCCSCIPDYGNVEEAGMMPSNKFHA
jgi:hypothetical protein